MIKQYREAIIFLLKYLGVYLVLNTGYSVFIRQYHPAPDPITIAVTANVASVLRVFNSSVDYAVTQQNPNVPITLDGTAVVEVFEGCNSINVMIVYVAFLIAFNGPLKQFLIYFVTGLIAIYGINLLRVLGLFEVALHFPEQLYFFHKFFFTGIIYMFVFILWFFWVKAVKKWTTPTEE
jgi:exosortase family protein XrtF